MTRRGLTPRVVRRLALALGAVYASLGMLEVVLKVAGDSAASTIAFFGGTLLGGAGLIFVGLYARALSSLRRPLVILGAVLGFPASAWTIVVPVLAITVIAANAASQAPSTAEAQQH